MSSLAKFKPSAGGSAKAWSNLNGTGTISERDSFNISSYSDNGTGNYTYNYANHMSDTNYCWLPYADFRATIARNTTIGYCLLYTSPSPRDA